MTAYALAKPLDPVVRPLGAALADPLVAPVAQPLGDIAAMDGYAVAGPGRGARPDRCWPVRRWRLVVVLPIGGADTAGT